MLTSQPSGSAHGICEMSLQELEAMFLRFGNEGTCDLQQAHRWRHTFFDFDAEKLRSAAAELTRFGYEIAGLEETPRGGAFLLHVERVDLHTPQTLQRSIVELCSWLNKHALAGYDEFQLLPRASAA